MNDCNHDYEFIICKFLLMRWIDLYKCRKCGAVKGVPHIVG